MELMLSRKRAAVVTLLGILVLALLFLNSQRYWVRFDLTSAKAYTLSATSKDLYKKIDERVTVTYYLSDALAKMHPSPGMIVDLLREYEAYSRGRVRVVVEDPSRNRSAAIAERLGIAPQLIRPNDRDQERVQTVYSGIVVEYLNRTETIPSVASIETLEYDLTSRIISLLENSPRTIAIVDAVKDADPGTDLAQLANALEGSGYRMSEISLSQGIPSNFPALFVIGGADELKDAELARVEEYLRGGGGVLFAVDGVSVASKGDLRALPVGASPLLDFLQTKGVSVSRELALDVAALTIPYQTRGPSSASSVPHAALSALDRRISRQRIQNASGHRPLSRPRSVLAQPPGIDSRYGYPRRNSGDDNCARLADENQLCDRSPGGDGLSRRRTPHQGKNTCRRGSVGCFSHILRTRRLHPAD